MGRGFIVEDAVEGYLSNLCEQPTSPTTGLLIGQVQYKCSFHKSFYSAVNQCTNIANRIHDRTIEQTVKVNIVTLKEKHITIDYTML